jgi:hypothetical protein
LDVRYPRLPETLREQLGRIEPSHDGVLEYRPGRAVLDDGTQHDFVLFVAAASYFPHWGVWPENDPRKRALPVERVVSVRESTYRLPPTLANQLYDAGESGMGYFVFTVVLRDGRRLPVVTGNAVDFPALPDAVTTADIIDVLPTGGREHFLDRQPSPQESAGHYSWCLYED